MDGVTEPAESGTAAGSPLVLVGGGHDDLAAWLGARLASATVRTAADGREVVAQMADGPPAVLVLDSALGEPDLNDVLRRARGDPALAGAGVVCCLDRDVDADRLRTLVEELGVQRVLFNPVDREELARAVAALVGLPAPATEATDDRTARAETAIAAIAERFRARAAEHIEILDRLALALLEGEVDPALREEGRRAAHKLTGTMGTFGFAEGSRLAAEVERGLETGAGPEDAGWLSEASVALRRQLEQEEALAQLPSPPPEAGRRTLLLVGVDDEMADRVVAESATRGLTCLPARDARAALAAVNAAAPDVVLLDLAGDEGDRDALALLEDLARRTPPVPVLVLTEPDGLADRVRIARLGARGFLHKPVVPAQAAEAAANLLQRLAPGESGVLAVDDDPAVLETVRGLLESQQRRVSTLGEPLRFWDALEGAAPDLVVLDVDMPRLSGIELCRALRADPRWVGTPVLFLTARQDAETIRRVFAAGADDFVSKPVVGPELIARIENRLERTRLQATIAEVDPLTGVANRRHSTKALERLIRLAERFRQPMSVAVVDLDGLKGVNELHGHSAGDRVLRRLGGRLLRAFGADDAVGRWGGAEFVVGMHGLGRAEAVQLLASVLEGFRQESFRGADGTPFTLTVSAGVAEYPVDGSDLPTIYRAAEGAVARAKELGPGRIVPAGLRPDRSEADVQAVDVAVVEDDESLGGLLVHALTTRGHSTLWIPDGREAVEALAGAEPRVMARVVLLDWDLPAVDGLTVLRAMAETGVLRRTRVVMLTVRATEAEVLKTFELGAFDHVAKPFSVKILMHRIARALGH
jgi:diguanylate cyclase (GGDEF)-like protein